ncbi:MAG: hypothetical protein RR288_03290 [Oscillibacter sp.]
MAEFDEKLNAVLSNPDSMAQIMQLAQSLGATQSAPPPPPQPSYGGQQSPPPFFGGPPQQAPPAAGPDFLSALTGGLDPKLLTKLLPLVQELGSQQNSNSRQLLYALRPYLRAERQEKVERALQLARLIHLGKKFLAGWEG